MCLAQSHLLGLINLIKLICPREEFGYVRSGNYPEIQTQSMAWHHSTSEINVNCYTQSQVFIS